MSRAVLRPAESLHLHGTTHRVIASHSPMIAATIFLAFLTLIDAAHPQTVYITCKVPEKRWCTAWPVIWPMSVEEAMGLAHELYPNSDITRICGLSDLKPVPPTLKFVKVTSFKLNDLRTNIFCKAVDLIIKNGYDWTSKNIGDVLRIRRQVNYSPRGRYRGQTQSQYLAIERGNEKDEGKAEAHSDADSSRASVSGNSGMGQAQSQTMFDPNCDDCVGRHNIEAESLHRGPYSPNQVGGGPGVPFGNGGYGIKPGSLGGNGYNSNAGSPGSSGVYGSGSSGIPGYNEGSHVSGPGAGNVYNPGQSRAPGSGNGFRPGENGGSGSSDGHSPGEGSGYGSENRYGPRNGGAPGSTGIYGPGQSGAGQSGAPGTAGGYIPNQGGATGLTSGYGPGHGGTPGPSGGYGPGSSGGYGPVQAGTPGATGGYGPDQRGSSGSVGGYGPGQVGTPGSIGGYNRGQDGVPRSTVEYVPGNGAAPGSIGGYNPRQNEAPGYTGGGYRPGQGGAPGFAPVYAPGQARAPGSTGEYGPRQTGVPGSAGGYGPGQGGAPGSTGGYGSGLGGFPQAINGYGTGQGGAPGSTGGYGPLQGRAPASTDGYGTGQGGAPGATGGYGPRQSGAPGSTGGYGPGQVGAPGSTGGFSSGQGGAPGSSSGYGPGQGGAPGSASTYVPAQVGAPGSSGAYGPGQAGAPASTGEYRPEYNSGYVPRSSEQPGTGNIYSPGGIAAPNIGGYIPGQRSGSGIGEPSETRIPGAPGSSGGSGYQPTQNGSPSISEGRPGSSSIGGYGPNNNGVYGPAGQINGVNQIAPGGTKDTSGIYPPTSENGLIDPNQGSKWPPTLGRPFQGPGGINYICCAVDPNNPQYMHGGDTSSGGGPGTPYNTGIQGPYGSSRGPNGGYRGTGTGVGPNGAGSYGNTGAGAGPQASGPYSGSNLGSGASGAEPYGGIGFPGGAKETGPYYGTGLALNGADPYRRTGIGSSDAGTYGRPGSEVAPHVSTDNGSNPSGTGTNMGTGTHGSGPYGGTGPSLGPFGGAGTALGPNGAGPYSGLTSGDGKNTVSPYDRTALGSGQDAVGPYRDITPGGGINGPFSMTGSGGGETNGASPYAGSGSRSGPSSANPYGPTGSGSGNNGLGPYGGGGIGSGPNGVDPNGMGPHSGSGSSGIPNGVGLYEGTGLGNGANGLGPYGGTGTGGGPNGAGVYGGTGTGSGSNGVGPYSVKDLVGRPDGQYEGTGTGIGPNRHGMGVAPNGLYGGTGTGILPNRDYGGTNTGVGPNGQYGSIGVGGPTGQYGGNTGGGEGGSLGDPYSNGLGSRGLNNVDPYGHNNNGSSGTNLDNGGAPQNVIDPNTIAEDGDDSEAEASVTQAVNGTLATAASKGGNDKGRAQTHVTGAYTGSGSFSAQAEISGENKAANSQVTGDKKGASSNAQGSGRNNKSQANVQLGSETGSIMTGSQSEGIMHSSNSQVQGSVKGGMADAQAKGPGSTSSQAQIGFTPYKDGEKKTHDLQKIPFVGGGTSSAQSSGRTGISQSQLRGTFKYGITYNGAAQSGASLDKDAVFPNRLPFEKIDVNDENNKNINVDFLSTDTPPELSSEGASASVDVVPSTDIPFSYSSEKLEDTSEKYSETQPLNPHTHSDHHKTDDEQVLPTHPPPIEGRRSFQPTYGTNSADYEYTTDRDDPSPPEEYDVEDGYGGDVNEGAELDQGEYNYNELARESEQTHQSLHNPKNTELAVKQTTGGNTQHILLDSLTDQDAEITQKNSEQPDESKVYQPGESIPGTGGYTIPVGFTGSVKSVASKEKTYVVGSKGSPSQAQTVTLTPGTGRIKYTYPSNYGRTVQPKDLRSLYSHTPDDNRYMSVSKSVTRSLDDENNIRKQYSHTYYTKSSSCGYFTFTCTMVSSAEGRKKVCKPKIPTNPDGTPMKC